MSENRHQGTRGRVAKRLSSAKKNKIHSHAEFWLTQNWLEDLEGYRTVLHRILQGNGVEYGVTTTNVQPGAI